MFYFGIFLTQFGKMPEWIFFRMIDIKSYVGTYPDISFRVFIKRCDKIIPDAPPRTVIMFEFTEWQTVISIQAIFGAEPHKALPVLQNRIDRILG